MNVIYLFIKKKPVWVPAGTHDRSLLTKEYVNKKLKMSSPLDDLLAMFEKYFKGETTLHEIRLAFPTVIKRSYLTHDESRKMSLLVGQLWDVYDNAFTVRGKSIHPNAAFSHFTCEPSLFMNMYAEYKAEFDEAFSKSAPPPLAGMSDAIKRRFENIQVPPREQICAEKLNAAMSAMVAKHALSSETLIVAETCEEQKVDVAEVTNVKKATLATGELVILEMCEKVEEKEEPNAEVAVVAKEDDEPAAKRVHVEDEIAAPVSAAQELE